MSLKGYVFFVYTDILRASILARAAELNNENLKTHLLNRKAYNFNIIPSSDSFFLCPRQHCLLLILLPERRTREQLSLSTHDVRISKGLLTGHSRYQFAPIVLSSSSFEFFIVDSTIHQQGPEN